MLSVQDAVRRLRGLAGVVPDDALVGTAWAAVPVAGRWRLTFHEVLAYNGVPFPYREFGFDDAPLDAPVALGLHDTRRVLWRLGWTDEHLALAQTAVRFAFDKTAAPVVDTATTALAVLIAGHLTARAQQMEQRQATLLGAMAALNEFLPGGAVHGHQGTPDAVPAYYSCAQCDQPLSGGVYCDRCKDPGPPRTDG